jgi:hypothetical protein
MQDYSMKRLLLCFLISGYTAHLQTAPTVIDHVREALTQHDFAIAHDYFIDKRTLKILKLERKELQPLLQSYVMNKSVERESMSSEAARYQNLATLSAFIHAAIGIWHFVPYCSCTCCCLSIPKLAALSGLITTPLLYIYAQRKRAEARKAKQELKLLHGMVTALDS